MRKISRTLALMGLLAPLGANALGIGDIRLHSALNQSLNAEIPLVTSGGEDVSEMKVTLATQEAFAKAGIERHYSLSKLRFKPQQKEDGSYVIKVTSSESIREPFLNFMIEVHWPQGRMQREFTVLLDPPANFQESDVANEELPEREVYQRSYEPPIRRRPVAEPAPPKPRRPAIKAARTTETPAASVETGPVTGTQYGPIARNETLWSIARQFNQDASISQQKMLSALYKANPQAFYKNSINALKAGETITIPDRETIVRLTGAPSASQSLRTGKLRTETPTPKKEEETGIASGEAAAGTQGQLKLLAPTSSKPKDEAATSGVKGKTKEELALETAAGSVRRENEEIRKRLAEFEQQLSGMQRLLTLKDEQIAALQNAQKEAAKQASPATAIPSQPQATGPAAIPEAQQQPMSKPSVTSPAPEVAAARPQQPPLAPEQAKELPKAVIPPTAPQQEAIPTPPAAPPPKAEVPPAPKPPASKPAVQQARPVQPPAPVKEEEGLLSELLDQPSYLIGGATGFLLITLVTAVWIKRRRAAMIDEAESILTLSDREKTLQLKRTPVPLDTSPTSLSEQSTTARSSFLSEFTPSDFDALGGEMEEVDPISEADVYLAYGRYKQAEELIRSAIAQNPERDECKLKLLEIHYATENAQAFEKFAQELALTHKDTKPEFWEKVVEMGEELCPGSSLFGDGNEPAMDSNRSNPIPASVKEKAVAAEEHDYLSEKETEESDSHPAATTAEVTRRNGGEEKAEPTIAYDFFSTETPASGTKGGMEDEPDIHLTNNILSFDKAQDNTVDGSTDLQNKTLDDILEELGVLSESAQHTAKGETGESQQGNEIEYAFELDHTAETDEPPQYDVDSTDYLGLTEMDEQETKLDLAKAYFDMGDADSARVILEHVTQHGNDAQKEEAWSLLGSLAKKEVNRR